MTPRVRFSAALSVVLTVALSAGCHRAMPASAKGGGPAAVPDYRTFTKAEVLELIRSTTGWDVSDLADAGPNHYTGAVKSPDGTSTLPLEVTVEAQRIVCDTKTPAGSNRQIVTPRGVEDGGLIIK